MDQPQTIAVEYFDFRKGGWTVVKVAEQSPVWRVLNDDTEKGIDADNIRMYYRKIEGL